MQHGPDPVLKSSRCCSKNFQHIIWLCHVHLFSHHQAVISAEMLIAAHLMCYIQRAGDLTQSVCADAHSQLQQAQHSLSQLQQQLQSEQQDSHLLQVRLDAAVRAKQEAQDHSFQLGEEVRQMRGQVQGSQHSMALLQSQQLELQVSSKILYGCTILQLVPTCNWFVAEAMLCCQPSY